VHHSVFSTAAQETLTYVDSITPGLSRYDPQDLTPSATYPGYSATYFRRSGYTRQIRKRNLHNSQPLLECLDLHFNGPAEVFIPHIQLLQSLPTDNTHGTEILIRATPEEMNQTGGEAVAETLLHTQGFTLNRYPLRQDQIELKIPHTFKQRADFSVVVTSISISKRNISRRQRTQRLDPCKARTPVPQHRLLHHAGSMALRYLGGCIGRTIINHNNFINTCRNAA